MAERASWRVMYGYVRPHRRVLLAGGLLSLLTGVTGLALPLVVRALIVDLGQHRSVTLLLLAMTGLVVANAALDALNEAALRETVTEVAPMTTVLVVAHRLSTVTMADRIIVMDAGLVKAVGTHAELVAGDPLYAELAPTQFLASAA